MVHSFMEEIIFHWEKLSKQNEGQVEFMKAVNKTGKGIGHSREIKEP